MTPGLERTPGLKEWGAAIHGLLDGRQTVLLRKGGIHEKRFAVDAEQFVLFPTVVHSPRSASGPNTVTCSTPPPGTAPRTG